jgi:hypothetical protein
VGEESEVKLLRIILWTIIIAIFAWGILTSEPDPEADTRHAYP